MCSPPRCSVARERVATIEAYRREHGAEPADLAALVGTDLLDREPRDPKGGTYRIEGGRAATDLRYSRLEVHRAHAPSKPQIERDYRQMERQQDGGAP